MFRRGSSRGVRPRRGESLEALLERVFRLYYSARPCLEEPPKISMREFAFQLFGREGYVRHISFESYEEMLEFISREAPKHSYYSIALYELPEAGSMEEKSWLGSDLLFDIDLDHAEACSESSIQAPGGVLLSDECLLEGYRLARKLEAMVRRDLSPERTVLYFTGNRGFHLRVECEDCMGLTRQERREIARYFAGEGVEPGYIFPSTGRRRRERYLPALPEPGDPGWRGWIAPILRAANPNSRGLRGGWAEQVEEAIREARVPIDVMVTQDPSRLTRILGSLNGKGALLAVEAGESFSPSWKALSPFRGTAEARFSIGLEGYRLLGTSVSARRGEVQSLPAGLALHLATRGAVEIVGGEIVVGESACGRPL